MNRNDEAERLLALPQAAQKAAWAFRQGSTSMIRLYPGALEMIEKLQEAGIVVALLSNAQSCYTRAELEMTGHTALKGQSWKLRLINAIDECMKYAADKDAFI